MLNTKKKLILSIIIVIVIVSLGFIFYNLNKWQVYNKTLTDANKAMSLEQYDKAIILYGEALDYKSNSDLNKDINIAKLLKKSKEIYTTAVKQMASKDYLTAIDTFKKVDKQDTKRYKTAQSKIDECKKLYIADNLKSANDSLSNSKFDDANKYVANILKIDSNNSDAAKVKESIAKAIQKQANDEKAKETQEKAEAAAKLASSNSTPQTSNSNNSNKITPEQALSIAKKHNTDTTDTIEPVQPNLIKDGQEYYLFSAIDYVGGGEADFRWCVNAKTGAICKYYVDGTFRP